MQMALFKPGYLKEGKGVDRNAPEKNRFFLFFELFFGHLGRLITVNVVYLVTMLPLFLGLFLSFNFKRWPFAFSGDIVGIALIIVSIFTSFPMTCGFTYVIRNMQRREHAWIIRDMFKHAKLNYKKAVINGVIQLAAYFLFYVAIIFYAYNVGGQTGFFCSCIVLVASLVFMWLQFYMNLMIVTFDLKLSHIYKNALIFAIAKAPLNLLITVICAALALACLLYVPVAINVLLLILIYPALFGFITVYCIYPTIDKNMISKAGEADDENS